MMQMFSASGIQIMRILKAMPSGRPTGYTPELAAEIIARLAAGESLRKICTDDHMPHESTVRLWATDDREGFSTQYTRARQAQMDALAEDILEIADGEDTDVNRARLRVDTRKWLMSKIAPKRFGEKVVNEHVGANGGPIQSQNFNIDPDKLKDMSDDEINALERAIGKLHGSVGSGEGRKDEAGDEGSYSAALNGEE